MDTAGQEYFNAINEYYYKQADCCLLVYDISNKKSFERVKTYYIPKIKEYSGNIIKVILLGNKTDLKNKRQVTDLEGADLAKKNSFVFMESSCVNNYNVLDAFTTLVEMTNNELKKDITTHNNISLNQKELINNISIKKKCKC